MDIKQDLTVILNSTERVIESLAFRYKSDIKNNRQTSRFITYLLIIMASIFILYSFLALTKPLPLVTAKNVKRVELNTAQPVLIWPASGQAAIGSLEEGLLAKSTTTETVLPTASIAKVITALAVMNKKPFANNTDGELLTLDQTDINFYNYYTENGGSNVPVSNGEQITQRQAIEAMLLPSANNMADSLAYWAFGSLDAYVAYANTMVAQWGLSSTKITDASGFSPATVSTASELVIIGQHVLKNSVLRDIVSEKQAQVPNVGIISNTNVLLGTDGVIGIKTGFTYEAGGCLLFAATHTIDPLHSTTIIGTVQGTPTQGSSFTSAQILLASAKNSFKSNTIVKAGTKVGMYSSKWGQTSQVTTLKDINYYGWNGHIVTSQLDWHAKKSPIPAHTTVGAINVTIAGKKYSSDLVTTSTISKPSLLWRLSHYL